MKQVLPKGLYRGLNCKVCAISGTATVDPRKRRWDITDYRYQTKSTCNEERKKKIFMLIDCQVFKLNLD